MFKLFSIKLLYFFSVIGFCTTAFGYGDYDTGYYGDGGGRKTDIYEKEETKVSVKKDKDGKVTSVEVSNNKGVTSTTKKTTTGTTTTATKHGKKVYTKDSSDKKGKNHRDDDDDDDKKSRKKADSKSKKKSSVKTSTEKCEFCGVEERVKVATKNPSVYIPKNAEELKIIKKEYAHKFDAKGRLLPTNFLSTQYITDQDGRVVETKNLSVDIFAPNFHSTTSGMGRRLNPESGFYEDYNVLIDEYKGYDPSYYKTVDVKTGLLKGREPSSAGAQRYKRNELEGLRILNDINVSDSKTISRKNKTLSDDDIGRYLDKKDVIEGNYYSIDRKSKNVDSIGFFEPDFDSDQKAAAIAGIIYITREYGRAGLVSIEEIRVNRVASETLKQMAAYKGKNSKHKTTAKVAKVAIYGIETTPAIIVDRDQYLQLDKKVNDDAFSYAEYLNSVNGGEVLVHYEVFTDGDSVLDDQSISHEGFHTGVKKIKQASKYEVRMASQQKRGLNLDIVRAGDAAKALEHIFEEKLIIPKTGVAGFLGRTKARTIASENDFDSEDNHDVIYRVLELGVIAAITEGVITPEKPWQSNPNEHKTRVKAKIMIKKAMGFNSPESEAAVAEWEKESADFRATKELGEELDKMVNGINVLRGEK